MAKRRPAALCSRMYDFYELKVLGRTGAEYSRLLATGLLSRAAISGDRSFKLELELQSTDTPNDYVAFYSEGAKEWWLIQVEHSLDAKELTWEEMFCENQATGDLSMVECFKTFLRAKQNWRFGGAKVRLFVFTNRPLHESGKSKDVAVDELIKFSEGHPVQLLPAQEDTQKIAKHVNCRTGDTVKTFFSDLVLLVAQPSIETLEEEIRSDWRRWMKSWIRPDVLCRLTANQLSEPFVTFKRNFQEWEQPTEGRFLTQYEGAKCLKAVEKKLRSYIEQDVLDDEENYYANRWVTFRDRSESIKRMHDNEFIEWLYDNWSDQQQCIALFAKPGMGKTTLWQQLAFRMQQSRDDVDVYLIYLNDLEEKFPMVNENANIESAVNALGAVISREHVKPLLNKRQKVVVFMDAFDVLKGDHKQSMINLVKVFEKDRSNVKFLISSRECCKGELVRCLQVKSIHVVPFDENDCRDFLRSLWRVKEEHYTKFDAFLKELLIRFDREPPRGDDKFAGLPLTTKMLAEVFLESFNDYRYTTNIELDTLLLTISIDELYVYEKFIATSIILTQNKKWQLNYGTKRMLEAFKEYIGGETENYQLIAMQQMKLEHLFEGSQRARLQQFYKTIPEEPLLLETVNGSTCFTHRTYAEYLCAKFLLDKLSNSTGISTRIMKDLYDALKHHVGIRRFFLKILDVKLGETQHDASHNIQNVVKNLRKMPDDVLSWASDDNYANLLSCVPKADESSSAERGDETMKGDEGLLQRISCFGFRFR